MDISTKRKGESLRSIDRLDGGILIHVVTINVHGSRKLLVKRVSSRNGNELPIYFGMIELVNT